MTKYMIFEEDWGKAIDYLHDLLEIYRVKMESEIYRSAEKNEAYLREIKNLKETIEALRDAEPIDL